MKASFSLWICLFTALLASKPLVADDFYRIFYNEELKTGAYKKMQEWEGLTTDELKARVEESYGAKILFLPYENDHKPKPSEVTAIDGWFLFASWDDLPWVNTRPGMNLEENFTKVHKNLLKKIQRTYPDIKDLGDKFDEYRFLTTFFPLISPPEMRVATDFMEGKETAAEKKAIEDKVKGVMASKKLTDSKLEKDLVKLELIRTRINQQLGFSVMKNRGLNHSEGRLPKSKKEWVELYANYVASGDKAKLEKFLKSDEGGFAEFLLELDYAEGYALETLLKTPKKIIVQKMVDLKREVRMHINHGKILKGATFLRFYKLNEYLPPEDQAVMEKAVEENLLAKMDPEDRENFYASPDIYLTKAGKVLIGDFNDDIDSGYLYPEEDAITTNLFALDFRGQNNPPPYLVLLDAFRTLPITHDKKLPALMEFLERSAPFMQGDVFQAYFDRIGDSYLEHIAEARGDAQKSKEYGLAIEHLLHYKDAAPKMLHLATQKAKDEFYSNYQYSILEFVAHFQDLYPHLRAPVSTMRYLRDHLKGMSPEVKVVLSSSEGAGPESRIVATEREEDLTVRELRDLRRDMRKNLTEAKKSKKKYRGRAE